MPRPDVVAVNGEAAAEQCRRAGYPAEELVAVEALRYAYLEGFRASPPGTGASSDASDVLVVVGDIVPRLTERLLRMVEQAVPLLARQPRVLVKPHPNCPVDPGAFPGISFALTSEPMHVILRSGPTVLTSSGTSASVDACCAGVSVIVGLDDDEVNGSPLFGRDDVRFVSGARELASAIDEARAPGSRRDPGECFYLDASMVRWLRLLGN